MIEESGRVVAVEEGTVWVESIRQTACDSCAAQKGCGQSALAKLGQQHKSHVKALNAFDLKVGDEVVIGVPEDVVMKGTLVAYLMPLVLMLVAAVAADSFTQHDLWISLAGVLGLAVGFLLVRVHFHTVSKDKRYQPVVLRLSQGEKSNFCPVETL